MAMTNKYAKYAMVNVAVAFIVAFILGSISIFFTLLAIGSLGFGIKGLMDYNKDHSIGGKAVVIGAIVVGALVIIASIILTLLRLIYS